MRNKIAHCVGIPFHSHFHILCVLKKVVASLLGWWCDQRKKNSWAYSFSWPVLFVRNDLFEKQHKNIIKPYAYFIHTYIPSSFWWFYLFSLFGWFGFSHLLLIHVLHFFVFFFSFYFISHNESNRCDQQARLYWIKLLKRMLLLSNKYHALFFYDSNIFFIYFSFIYTFFFGMWHGLWVAFIPPHRVISLSFSSSSFQLLFTSNIL